MTSFITSILCQALLFGTLSHAAPTRRDDSDSDSPQIEAAKAVLLQFASTVTSDPNGVVATWVGDDVCSWSGISCDVTPDGYNAVAAIDLNEAELDGDLSLVGFLDQLPTLAFFHANSNNFAGTVPDISSFQYFYELDVSNNILSGDFPTGILTTAAGMSFVDVRFNQFSGSLPDDLFQYDIEAIFVNNNQFTGPIPEFTGTNSSYISMANNQLTGEIPESFANNVGALEILFLGNQLSGNVPEGLCALPLTSLDVSNNPDMSGELGPNCQALLDSGVLVIDGTGLTPASGS